MDSLPDNEGAAVKQPANEFAVTRRAFLASYAGSLGSLALAHLLGADGLLAFAGSFGHFSGFRSVDVTAAPRYMISWRGLLVKVLPPTVTEEFGLALTGLLSALTVGTLPLIWRGSWAPSERRFPPQMLATMLVTMLAGFHNHAHGAALLLVPGMVLAAQGGGPRALRTILRAGVYVPSIVFCLSADAALTALVLGVLLLAALAVIVAGEYRGRRPIPGAWPLLAPARSPRPSAEAP
jgi:hypothetical protein